MKRLYLLWVLCLFFLYSCALFPKITKKISWPQDVDYMEAMCELNMAWMDMNYSGTMSLVMEYPDRLSIEVYSPFGDTVFFLNRYKEYFLLLTAEEKITNEMGFQRRFNLNLKDFIDDLALKGIKCIHREDCEIDKARYKVIYRLNGENTICWEAMEGKICIKFMEATFKKKD